MLIRNGELFYSTHRGIFQKTSNSTTLMRHKHSQSFLNLYLFFSILCKSLRYTDRICFVFITTPIELKMPNSNTFPNHLMRNIQVLMRWR
jgi:hypothetical protein